MIMLAIVHAIMESLESFSMRLFTMAVLAFESMLPFIMT